MDSHPSIANPADKDPDSSRRQAIEGTVVLGDGIFQGMVIACQIIAVTSYMCHATSFALTARVMDHWCRPPDDINMSTSQWKNIAIPVTEDGRNSQCSMYSPPLKTENSTMRTLIPCTEWDFDLEEYGSTIISEWSLVCSRSWLVHLASLLFHIGAAIGGVVFGTVADHIGRRPVAYFCIVINLLAGFGSGQHNSFFVFVTVRFMVAASSDTLMKVLFVILYEVSSPHKWLMYSFLCGLVPLVIVPVIIVSLTLLKFSWIVVHTIIMIPTSLLVVAFYFIQESPRWLLATGNIQEARKVVILAAATNHVSLKIAKQSLMKAEADMKGVAAENERTPPLTMKDMFLDPTQKKRSGILFFAWFAVDFAFSVNILRDYFVHYQSFTIAYVVFTPLGFAFLFFPIDRFGKKKVLVNIVLLLSFGTVLLTVTYDDTPTAITSALLVTVKILSSLAIFVLTIFTVELFPTELRSTGLCATTGFGTVATIATMLLTISETMLRKGVMLALITALSACGALALHMLPDIPSPALFFRQPEDKEEDRKHQILASLSSVQSRKSISKAKKKAPGISVALPLSSAPPVASGKLKRVLRSSGLGSRTSSSSQSDQMHSPVKPRKAK
ncbi:beta-alanine transporter-like [Ixodes scapularis]|uniref:beta-alanine transporter-like n=1 Tax=Ixodes scapularis TaxID=6945 RepID=UPI001A9FD296|nr:beta-alanine transporter-like [Ixodes scapularis]